MLPSQPALDQWRDTAHGPQKHQDSTQSPKLFSGRVIVRGRGVGESPDKARARAGNPIDCPAILISVVFFHQAEPKRLQVTLHLFGVQPPDMPLVLKEKAPFHLKIDSVRTQKANGMLEASWISAREDMEHGGVRLQARVHRAQGFRQVIDMFEHVVSEEEIKFPALQFGVTIEKESAPGIPFPGVLNRLRTEVASACPPARRQGLSENVCQHTVTASKVEGLTSSGKPQASNHFCDSPLFLGRPFLHVSAGIPVFIELD